MSLFDRTFLISTGVTVVICGAIYYYLNMKIRDLEQALVKQNQVLSSFIANVQQEFRAMAMARANGGGANGGGANGANGVDANGMIFEIVSSSNELASAEALAAVAELDTKKIVITESDCDSSSDADGSDTDDSASEADASETDASEAGASETDGSEADHNAADHNKLVICDLSMNDTKIIDISHLEIYTPEKDSEDESEDESESDSEEDGFHRVSKLVLQEANLNIFNLLHIEEVPSGTDNSKIEEITVEDPVDLLAPVDVLTHVDVLAPVDVLAAVEVKPATDAPAPTETPVPTTTKFDDLKVDELRKIVLEKDLVQKDEVKKLKKNELLAVLKKHII